jgi:GR25 family glycosyltransferase involved in LPS biosynthesis
MKHYWINIDSSAERRVFMEEQFKNNELANVRVSAITPKDFDDVLEDKRPLTCKHPGCVRCEYEYACISSHIKAMIEGLKDEDNEWFVVMEDDIVIPFEINYNKMLSELPKDAQLVQLLILYGSTVKALYNLSLTHNINFIKWQYLLPSTGMYIISREGAKILVGKYFNSKNNKYDFTSCEYQVVADVALYSTINSYATTFPFAYPNIDLVSEIHPEHYEAHKQTYLDIKEVIDYAVNKANANAANAANATEPTPIPYTHSRSTLSLACPPSHPSLP